MIFDHMIASPKFAWQQVNSRIALSYLEVKNIYQLFRENYVMTSNIVVLAYCSVSDEKVASNESSIERKLDVQKLMTICSANFLKGQKKKPYQSIEKATKNRKNKTEQTLFLKLVHQ